MKVRFVVNPRGVKSTDPGEKLLALERSDWDDYGFGTTFTLYVVEGEVFDFVGNLKIAEYGQSSNGAYTETVHTKLDPEFTQLREDQFSVAQDATYYRNLIDKVGSPLALEIAERLNDLASMEHIPDRIIEERVTQRSLLRYVSLRTVMDQYRDLLHGKTLPQPFSLTYHFDSPSTGRKEMVFEVKPGSVLPTNLHVIIGPNGMGKTRTLRRIAAALDERDPEHDPSALAFADRRKFAGLVSVSFSAFDIFPERNRLARSQAEFRVTRVGLPIKFEEDEESLDIDAVLATESDEPRERTLQTAAEMQSEYWEKLVEGCLANRPEPLMAALSLLADADQVLANAGIADSKALMSLDFAGLSSGHKIVLLTMCSLVRYCEARTLVLVDEPESHLHPTLIGAFSRALSDLMSTTNGLAIVATHSPVVLQEVPSSCAWKIWSLEGIGTVKRPELQTFGENLGVLTEEVFGLELDKSGYHALLREIASRFEDYASAKDHLDGRLGQEAKVLLRTMIEMDFQK